LLENEKENCGGPENYNEIKTTILPMKMNINNTQWLKCRPDGTIVAKLKYRPDGIS